jgi:hypothetical protein
MTHILFSSDNPFVPLAETAEGMTEVGFSTADHQLIRCDNVFALMPQLKIRSAFANSVRGAKLGLKFCLGLN